MKAKWTTRKDGERFEIPLDTPYRLGCCDCGLVHDVAFTLVEGKLMLTAFRNNRSTGQRRRHMKKTTNNEYEGG